MASESDAVDYDVLLAAFRIACRALIPRVKGMRSLFEDIAIHAETEGARFLVTSILQELELEEANSDKVQRP